MSTEYEGGGEGSASVPSLEPCSPSASTPLRTSSVRSCRRHAVSGAARGGAGMSRFTQRTALHSSRSRQRSLYTAHRSAQQPL